MSRKLDRYRKLRDVAAQIGPAIDELEPVVPYFGDWLWSDGGVAIFNRLALRWLHDEDRLVSELLGAYLDMAMLEE